MMTRLMCGLFFAACSLFFTSLVQAQVQAQAIRIILVGDSTMAPETGYGDALCKRFSAAVTCLNLAKGGRSSASYRSEGSWAKVGTILQDKKNFTATYVLIQFGHNDQPGKPGRSTDLATEFPANMEGYAREVSAAQAIPVLVTPLARRIFKEGVVQNTLQPWADATRTVAKSLQISLLELNRDSVQAVQEIGSAEADTLAMAAPSLTAKSDKEKGQNYRGFDYTHLGAKGANYFANIVELELRSTIPAISDYFLPEH